MTKDDLHLRSPEGAGSLWYAPPELNPPVEGVFNKPGERNRLRRCIENHMTKGAVIGKSDMWSAGVVIYLLLAVRQHLKSAFGVAQVGHNPFISAQKLKDTQKVPWFISFRFLDLDSKVEEEVLRLVAKGW